MSMDRQTIEAGMKQARQFLTAGRLALERLDLEKSGYRYRDEENWTPKPTDRSWGSPETGALRRSSMDLTRKLAELRKP